jgi:type IV secretory pathway TraG/TraD family ATPase VirD4
MDEINSYISDIFVNLINKSREANVTCILATQCLSDLDIVNPMFRIQIIENCNVYNLLRQNSPENAEVWADIFGTKPDLDTTYQITSDKGVTSGGDKGTIKQTRSYIFHPDDIKTLSSGECFYCSKDDGFYTKLNVIKPF